MKLLRTLFAYIAAIVIVAVIKVTLEQLAHHDERTFMSVVGLVFAGVGLWLTLWPKAAMRRYEQNQLRTRRWKEKYSHFMKAFEEASDQAANTALGETLAQEVYRKPSWTRILGIFACLFGSAVVFVALFAGGQGT